jgi:hypothetical protein
MSPELTTDHTAQVQCFFLSCTDTITFVNLYSSSVQTNNVLVARRPFENGRVKWLPRVIYKIQLTRVYRNTLRHLTKDYVLELDGTSLQY